METVNEIAENLKCPSTHDFLIDPVTVSDGTVYERVEIRNHLAAKREEGEAPRGATTNQPLLPMRHEGKYRAEDEDACFYTHACEIKQVLGLVRRDTAAANGGIFSTPSRRLRGGRRARRDCWLK